LRYASIFGIMEAANVRKGESSGLGNGLGVDRSRFKARYGFIVKAFSWQTSNLQRALKGALTRPTASGFVSV